MRVAAAIWTLALPICLQGCTGPPVSVRPLYTEAERERPHTEPRIEGEWISPDLGKAGTETGSKWKVAFKTQQSGGHYQVEISDPDGDGRPLTYDVTLVPMGERLFFDAQPSQSKEERESRSLGLVPLHLVGPLWLEQDFMRLALLDQKWVDENLSESLRAASDDEEILTSSTAELRDLVGLSSNNPKALLVWYLCRPGTDCAARAVDDMLERAPDDDDTLGEVARFFIGRRDYVRALAVRRHLVELNPKQASRHEELGKTLLFNRNFADARRAFAVATALTPVLRDDPETFAREGVVWSYFLEGRFADAFKAATDGDGTSRSPSATSILLGYLSLLRIGDRAAAESWLNRQTASFVGSPGGHILLLNLQRRVKEVRNSADAEPANSLNAAVTHIVDGDPKVAAQILEHVLANAPVDSLMALAARIELENLRSGIKR